MNYLMAFILAVGITCLLIVKGGNRFPHNEDNYEDRKDEEQ